VIAVAGEALFDLVLRGPGQPPTLHSGGGPFNAARTIGRLGGDVAFLGSIADDELGRRLLAELRQDGVGLESVVASSAPTTLALAELDGGANARYRFYTVATAAAGLTAEAALSVLPTALEALHVGTLGLVLEPTAHAVEALVHAVSAETVVLVDPNCRPAAIDEPDAYRGRLGRILARADLVKVSDDDLAWLEPGRDPESAARALLERGPTVVLVTRGAREALVVTQDAVEPVPAPVVRVVDTIGAGDAFSGAFLAWWQRESLGRGDLARLDHVLAGTQFACLVAARTCERAGASPPTLAELDA
jgi:fructokinase